MAEENYLESYNPLYDVHLQQYFSSPHMQKHLKKMGLLASTFNLDAPPPPPPQNAPGDVYARHHIMMDMMLKNREVQLMKMADLRKKLDAAEKVETCRRIRSGQSPDSFGRPKPSRSLSRGRPVHNERRARRFSNSMDDKEFAQKIEAANTDAPPPATGKDPYKRLSANVRRYQYLHKLDDPTLQAYKENLKKQLNRLERFREVSFGPHSVARQPPQQHMSWFFRRRSLPSLTASAPANTLQEPIRSINSLRGRSSTQTGGRGGSTSVGRQNHGQDQRISCPPTNRKRKDSNSRLPPISGQRIKLNQKPPQANGKPPAPKPQPQQQRGRSLQRREPPTPKKSPSVGRTTNGSTKTTTTVTKTVTTKTITTGGVLAGAAAALAASAAAAAATPSQNDEEMKVDTARSEEPSEQPSPATTGELAGTYDVSEDDVTSESVPSNGTPVADEHRHEDEDLRSPTPTENYAPDETPRTEEHSELYSDPDYAEKREMVAEALMSMADRDVKHSSTFENAAALMNEDSTDSEPEYAEEDEPPRSDGEDEHPTHEHVPESPVHEHEVPAHKDDHHVDDIEERFEQHTLETVHAEPVNDEPVDHRHEATAEEDSHKVHEKHEEEPEAKSPEHHEAPSEDVEAVEERFEQHVVESVHAEPVEHPDHYEQRYEEHHEVHEEHHEEPEAKSPEHAEEPVMHHYEQAAEAEQAEQPESHDDHYDHEAPASEHAEEPVYHHEDHEVPAPDHEEERAYHHDDKRSEPAHDEDVEEPRDHHHYHEEATAHVAEEDDVPPTTEEAHHRARRSASPTTEELAAAAHDYYDHHHEEQQPEVEHTHEHPAADEPIEADPTVAHEHPMEESNHHEVEDLKHHEEVHDEHQKPEERPETPSKESVTPLTHESQHEDQQSVHEDHDDAHAIHHDEVEPSSPSIVTENVTEVVERRIVPDLDDFVDHPSPVQVLVNEASPLPPDDENNFTFSPTVEHKPVVEEVPLADEHEDHTAETIAHEDHEEHHVDAAEHIENVIRKESIEEPHEHHFDHDISSDEAPSYQGLNSEGDDEGPVHHYEAVHEELEDAVDTPRQVYEEKEYFNHHEEVVPKETEADFERGSSVHDEAVEPHHEELVQHHEEDDQSHEASSPVPSGEPTTEEHHPFSETVVETVQHVVESITHAFHSEPADGSVKEPEEPEHEERPEENVEENFEQHHVESTHAEQPSSPPPSHEDAEPAHDDHEPAYEESTSPKAHPDEDEHHVHVSQPDEPENDDVAEPSADDHDHHPSAPAAVDDVEDEIQVVRHSPLTAAEADDGHIIESTEYVPHVHEEEQAGRVSPIPSPTPAAELAEDLDQDGSEHSVAKRSVQSIPDAVQEYVHEDVSETQSHPDMAQSTHSEHVIESAEYETRIPDLGTVSPPPELADHEDDDVNEVSEHSMFMSQTEAQPHEETEPDHSEVMQRSTDSPQQLASLSHSPQPDEERHFSESLQAEEPEHHHHSNEADDSLSHEEVHDHVEHEHQREESPVHAEFHEQLVEDHHDEDEHHEQAAVHEEEAAHDEEPIPHYEVTEPSEPLEDGDKQVEHRTTVTEIPSEGGRVVEVVEQTIVREVHVVHTAATPIRRDSEEEEDSEPVLDHGLQRHHDELSEQSHAEVSEQDHASEFHQEVQDDIDHHQQASEPEFHDHQEQHEAPATEVHEEFSHQTIQHLSHSPVLDEKEHLSPVAQQDEEDAMSTDSLVIHDDGESGEVQPIGDVRPAVVDVMQQSIYDRPVSPSDYEHQYSTSIHHDVEEMDTERSGGNSGANSESDLPTARAGSDADDESVKPKHFEQEREWDDHGAHVYNKVTEDSYTDENGVTHFSRVENTTTRTVHGSQDLSAVDDEENNNDDISISSKDDEMHRSGYRTLNGDSHLHSSDIAADEDLDSRNISSI